MGNQKLVFGHYISAGHSASVAFHSVKECYFRRAKSDYNGDYVSALGVSKRPWNRAKLRTGFTLIEMVVVLIILALLAAVAFNSVEIQVDQTRFDITQRVIENVDNAIFESSVGADGRSFMSGFVVDMGRPPVALVDLADADVLTLRELWQPIAITGLPAYEFRNANASTVSTTTDSSGQSISADQNVRIAAGWRGPYLQLPVGATELKDGWGHRLISPSETNPNPFYSHLRGDGDVDITSTGNEVYGLRSLGRENTDVASADPYDIDLPSLGNGIRLSDSSLRGTVTGQVHINSGLGATAGDVVVQIYFPDETNAAQISVERADVTSLAPTVPGFDSFNFVFTNTVGNEIDFPVGPRFIRAYFDSASDSSGDFNDSINDPPNQSVPTTVSIVPSSTSVNLTIN
ncbi:MAG: type II secretion system protein [Planctomycetota bacterium]